MQLISKTNCDRCVKIKSYLDEHKIDYKETKVENPVDLQVYRQMLIDLGKPLGFPILIKGTEITNGTIEEIINYLNQPKSFWSH